MQYIRLSDVVDNLSVARKDNDRQQYLASLILSKSVLRDLKLIYLNEFKRVYLAVDQSTNIVRLPFNFYRFRSISIIENCKDRFGRTSEKVIPLTLNPYINITPQEPVTCDNACNCEISHPVCQELANYELIEEDITIPDEVSPAVIGTRQTVLRTCANGDIIKEVTEPVQKWIEGDQLCNYSITIEGYPRLVCDYDLTVTVPVATSFYITFNINGVNVTSGLINVITFQAYMESLGWTFVSQSLGTFTFTFSDTSTVYAVDAYYINSLLVRTDFTVERHCVEVTTIEFPFTILSYVLNGESITPSPAETIVYQSDLDSFFTELGFTKVDDTHYTISDTEDVYFSMIIETGDSPAVEININFTQSGCRKPLISAGYENQLFTDVLCNVPLKECGCISETASAISTIVSCCSSYLHCCQVGELNNYSGWNVVPACCATNNEQPYNRFGTYNLDEKNYLIYLESVNASRVLLAYDTDGSCEGDFAVPDYCLEAMMAGIAFKTVQYDDNIHPIRRRELEINYSKELNKLIRDYTDPIRMADLVNALKTRKYPY